MMEAPDFMDGGSSITKAFILAMVKTRSITPTVDAVPVVRCKDCGNRECDGRAGTVVCGITGESHSRLWFCADGERGSSDG